MMAAEGYKKPKVKSPKIKEIFKTMEYGTVSESMSLAKTWLKEQQKGVICTYVNKKEEYSKGKATEIKDVQNQEILATLYSPNSEDVQKIISKSAECDKWVNIDLLKRGILLERLAREIDRNSTLFCQLEVSTRGILTTDTKSKALPLLIEYLQYYASWALKCPKYQSNSKKVTVSIVSDDSFLATFGFVLGPALAAGYNVILQTEPKISATATLIIELAESVGIPEGVIKLLPGSVNFNDIFEHKNVKLISSFGNLQANQYDLERPKSKTLLAVSNNSKIPMIVFNNGDLDSACDAVIDAAWGYQGMLPWSLNTLLVQEDILEIFVDKLKYRLSKVKMGPATDKLADVSYPSRTDAVKQLRLFINEAKLQGIEIFQNDPKCETFQPTLLIGGKVFSNNVILEDKNLPVVTVLAFRTSNEAVSLASNSRYGFGASLWTENIGLANEVAAKLDVGTVWINSYGSFTAATAINGWKQSGIGCFGGAEGFYEYLDEYIHTLDTIGFESKQLECNPLQSFYGGLFKKSESGLIDGVFDRPVGKDLYNAIAAAKKAQESWGKLTFLNRSQLLKKLADEMDQHKSLRKNMEEWEKILEIWIPITYEATAQLTNLGNVHKYKSSKLQSYKEPIGVIAIEEANTVKNYFQAIIGSLILGNSVIVLNSSPSFAPFYVELCKILSVCNIPAGVFNVILNCNNDVLKMVAAHKELNAYFMNLASSTKTKVKDLKHFYYLPSELTDVLEVATKVKNVWSNVGDSFL